MNNAFDLVQGIAYYIVFLFSATLHEAAHAWAAKVGGDLTAYRGGQVSLDPRPHVRREPFGMVILPLLSVVMTGWPFGFASAPYDPRWAERYPKRAGWMSLAGPAANLLIMIVAALLIRIGLVTGVFIAPESVFFGQIVLAADGGILSAAALMLGIFYSLNLVLVVLNLIPLPPLDGSGAIPLLLTPEATRRYRALIHQPHVGLFGILVAWFLFARIFDPLFLLAVNILYFPIVHYG